MWTLYDSDQKCVPIYDKTKQTQINEAMDESQAFKKQMAWMNVKIGDIQERLVNTIIQSNINIDFLFSKIDIDQNRALTKHEFH